MHKSLLLAAMVAAAWLPAAGAVLDFGNGPTAPAICTSDFAGGAPLLTCNNSRYIAQSYGDVAGVLDVQYIAPRAADGRSLRWWDSGYNNLYGVLWTEGGDETSQAAVTLLPAAGVTVSLQGFDLGSYGTTSRSTSVTVSEVGSGNVLFSYSGMVGNALNQATTFDVASMASSTGLRITWQDSAYNVGIDNIRYTVSAVPEPGAWALMAAGLLAIGTLVRRRHR